MSMQFYGTTAGRWYRVAAWRVSQSPFRRGAYLHSKSVNTLDRDVSCRWPTPATWTRPSKHSNSTAFDYGKAELGLKLSRLEQELQAIEELSTRTAQLVAANSSELATLRAERDGLAAAQRALLPFKRTLQACGVVIAACGVLAGCALLWKMTSELEYLRAGLDARKTRHRLQ